MIYVIRIGYSSRIEKRSVKLFILSNQKVEVESFQIVTKSPYYTRIMQDEYDSYLGIFIVSGFWKKRMTEYLCILHGLNLLLRYY